MMSHSMYQWMEKSGWYDLISSRCIVRTVLAELAPICSLFNITIEQKAN